MDGPLPSGCTCHWLPSNRNGDCISCRGRKAEQVAGRTCFYCNIGTYASEKGLCPDCEADGRERQRARSSAWSTNSARLGGDYDQ